MEQKSGKHYVLGFPRRHSGAFEHSWGFAQALKKAGYDSHYYAHWWGSFPKQVDLETEDVIRLTGAALNEARGFLYLQTHTWEYDGFLDMMTTNGNPLVFGLHAIIPYYHLSEKDKIRLLRGELSHKEFQKAVERISEREKAQLRAIKKADHLLTISGNHKKVLEMMGVKKPIHIFENASDFHDLPEETVTEGYRRAELLKGVLDSENVLLYCGNLYPKKGSFGLFSSFRKIREEYPSSKMVLVGTHPKSLTGFLSEGLIEEDMDFVVPVPWVNKGRGVGEFLPYFLAADVLVQPIVTPGLFSKSVIDAMTLGIPTITCESPYSIGTSGNSCEIFDAFSKIKENPEETRVVVERAKRKAKRENTWGSYISRLENIVLRHS